MIKKIAVLIIMMLYLIIMSCGLSEVMNPSDEVNNTLYSASESFVYEFPKNNQNQVFIHAINGQIIITGSSNISVIKIWGERIVKSESEEDAALSLEKLEAKATNTENVIYIETKQPSDTNGREFLVNYNLIVPSATDAAIELVNGSIIIDSLSGDINLEAVNGNIQLQETSGNLEINLTNGKVDCKMRLPERGSCGITTINAEIQLLIPKNTSANFAAGVINGIVSVSNLTIQNMQNALNFVNGTLGNGNGTIRLEAINGVISASGY